MDIGTHMLVGYMIAWTAAFTFTGYHEYLILLAVLMPMIPDFDIVLYAIPRRVRQRFRGLGHRGVTHSLVFLVGCAAVLTLVFNRLWGVGIAEGLIVGIIAGLSHALLDSLTSFAYPSLAPFTWKERSLDIDGAVTWYMVPFSVTSMVVMWEMRVRSVPFGTYELFVGLVFAVIICHYLARLSVKVYVERVLYRGRNAKVNPTFTLLSFYVVVKKNLRGVNITEYILTRLPRTRRQINRTYFELDRFDGRDISRPADIHEAVLFSSRAMAAAGMKNVSNLAAVPEPAAEGGWKIFWFDWAGWNPVRGTSGTVVTISPDGRLGSEGATRKISW